MQKRKAQYQYPQVRTRWRGNQRHQWLVYPHMRNQSHRRFSTKQEKALTLLHLIEYRDSGLKLRPARGKALPDSSDDKPNATYHVAKSWKHHSRRRHQYYRETHP